MAKEKIEKIEEKNEFSNPVEYERLMGVYEIYKVQSPEKWELEKEALLAYANKFK